MDNDPTDDEKRKLGYEAFDSFLGQFKPLDNYSIALLEVLFEMLMSKKKRDDFTSTS